MGKKKFDKSKGVTFKLVFRSEDEHANSEQTLSERIFSVIETQKKDADKNNDKERQKILSQFTKEDLGQAPVKKPKAKPLPGESLEPKEAISSHTKGRNDLWITHLMRMKEQAKAEVDEEEEEEERQKALKMKKAWDKAKEKAKAKGKDDEEEEEEWESCDEEGDEEDDGEDEYEIEEMEIDEEDLEDDEEEKEERILVKGRPEGKEEENAEKNVLEHVEKNKESQQPVIKEEDFPDLAAVGTVEAAEELAKVPKHEEDKTKQQELEELAEEEIDLTKVKVKGNVKMKRYDDLGLPMDGYNYYQHIADPSKGGAPTFAFTAQYDKVFKLPEDIDLKKEKMTAEEKEVYEALEYEGEAPVYEDLEDDFFTMLTKGEGIQVTEGGNEPAKETKKVTFGDNEIKEILSSKEPPKNPEAPKGKDGIYSRKDFQKVLKQHVNFLKDKYKEEREKNRIKYNLPESDEEEEDVEEVDESWDEDDEENRPKGYVERLKFEDDVAAQQAVAKSLSDLDSSFEEEERQTRANKEASTRAATEAFAVGVKVRHAKLNIIKEGGSENKKLDEDKEKDKDGSIEVEEEEEEEQGNRVEEVFKKREKGETKEEKKQRKAAIKQFKQERKEKKKKFKENFEIKKKEQAGIAYRQTNNLQGLSVYKLTV